ncbi:hypothetical protein BDR07DRAFT_1432975 [Suillus spraguei]|nr:hypothetical protein BDR07DRAFT_1432975 [Suillus spraguei]
MTFVSNDPTWWSSIDANILFNYFVVAALVAVAYDWVLTLGQEVELIWRQRWSLMTFLYLGVRYLGIIYATLVMLNSAPTIPLTDTGCFALYAVWDLIGVVVIAMLLVIIITRLHALYHRSRKILVFLVVTSLAVTIFGGMITVMTTMYSSGEEFILSGTYQCWLNYAGDMLRLISLTWIFGTVWEVLALCLAVWNAVKHFHELRRHSAGGIIGDCFTVLIKTHVLYFASFVVVSCFHLIYEFSPVSDENSIDDQIYQGLIQIFQVVQMSVMGPRLILSVREHYAKLVVDSDAATCMTSVAFQERVHISTGSSV